MRTMARFVRRAMFSDCDLYTISLHDGDCRTIGSMITFYLRTSLCLLTPDVHRKGWKPDLGVLLDRSDWSFTALHMQETVQRKALHGMNWRACSSTSKNDKAFSGLVFQSAHLVDVDSSPVLLSSTQMHRFWPEPESSSHLLWELSLRY